MVTNRQLLKKPRTGKKRRESTPGLAGSPQKKGVCVRVFTKKPKKPNSALRKLARVRLPSTNKRVTVYLPGEGHSLNEHSVVLIRGGRAPDIPGVYYKAVRGKFDFGPVANRKSARSKYGVSRPVGFKNKKKK